MKAQVYSINLNISWKVLKENVIAVNLDDGNYYTFNFTASLIWQYVDQGKSLQEIEQLMKEQFPDVTVQSLKQDIDDSIGFWTSEKLIKTIDNL
ncbi:MAG: PqqD family protein [Dysgonamonadaceae bacterium]|jgi:hypothetical protein|nr:PqqD family protein [Dysgonamonadaceae bacterium]